MRCFTRIYDFFYNNDVQLEDGLSLEEVMHILEKGLLSDGSDSEAISELEEQSSAEDRR